MKDEVVSYTLDLKNFSPAFLVIEKHAHYMNMGAIEIFIHSRCSPCFANRFFAIRCLQDLHRGSGLFDEHGVFRRKKEIPSGEYVHAKIECEQRTVYSSTFTLFSRTIICLVKK